MDLVTLESNVKDEFKEDSPPVVSLPRLDYHDMDPTRFEEEYEGPHMDHLQRAFFYPLCQWDIYWKGINGVQVIDPTLSRPLGCIVRAITYVSNPGSSVVQLELRRTDKGRYAFHLFSAKHGEHVYSDQDWDLHQTMLLWLRCLCKPEIPNGSVNTRIYSSRHPLSAHAHLLQFEKDTGVKEWKPSRWTSFDALLHHVCLYPHNGTKNLNLYGWRMAWTPGDSLEFWDRGSLKDNWYAPIRGAVHGYLEGKIHHHLCPQYCTRCKVNDLARMTHTNIDLSTLILQYSK